MCPLSKIFLGILQFIFYPFSLIYQFLFWWKKISISPKKLPVHLTISIGNLSLGGTGKTPFTLSLSRLILEKAEAWTGQKVQVWIVSRGYGGSLSQIGGEVENNTDPRESGDEPLLLKRNLPSVRVLVGKNRWENFLKIWKKSENLPRDPNQIPNQSKEILDIAILDDGFQHFAIARDLDIVLVDSQVLLGSGFTLPIGKLREKITALQRADVLVLTRAPEALDPRTQKWVQNVRNRFPSLKIFTGTESPVGVRILGNNGGWEEWGLDRLHGKSLFAFAGLGRPDPFFQSLKNLEPRTISTKAFPDHHYYSDADIQDLIRKSKDFDYLICTEKDCVKFREDQIQELRGQLGYLPIQIKIWEDRDWVEFWKNVLG